MLTSLRERRAGPLVCLLRTDDPTKLQLHMGAVRNHQEYIDAIAINVPLMGSPVRRSEKCQTKNRVSRISQALRRPRHKGCLRRNPNCMGRRQVARPGRKGITAKSSRAWSRAFNAPNANIGLRTSEFRTDRCLFETRPCDWQAVPWVLAAPVHHFRRTGCAFAKLPGSVMKRTRAQGSRRLARVS